MVKITDQVIRILRKNSLAREDDRYLLFAIYEEYGLILEPQQWAQIGNLPRPGSITRIRASVQNTLGISRSVRCKSKKA